MAIELDDFERAQRRWRRDGITRLVVPWRVDMLRTGRPGGGEEARVDHALGDKSKGALAFLKTIEWVLIVTDSKVGAFREKALVQST